MAWNEILLAVNSDPTTPLDEIIKGQRTLGASDSPIVIYYSSSSGVAISGKRGTFSPKTNGTIRIKAIAKYSGVSYGKVAILNKSNEEINHIPFEANVFEEKYVDIPIVKDETYTIQVSSLIVKHISVCATIVDSTLFDYEVN